MSRLQIPIPADLYYAPGYPHEEALFGIPKYGGTIAEVWTAVAAVYNR